MVREHAKQGGFPANRISEVKRMIDPTSAEVGPKPAAKAAVVWITPRWKPPFNPSETRPPSTARICPVMNCGAVAKKTTAAAISSSRPLRCMGVCLAIRRMNAAADFLTQIDHAGGDRVDGDFGSQSFCHDFGEHVQGGFRRTVMRVRGPGTKAAERTHIDDFGLDWF